jgi:hypothetical protein
MQQGMQQPPMQQPPMPQGMQHAPMQHAPMPQGMPYAARSASLHGAPGIYPLAEGREIKVGRDPGLCDICLTEPRVSGHHATLRLDGGQLNVRDDGSNNGTYINGAKIASHSWQLLGEGTMLRFGPVEFTVRFE